MARTLRDMIVLAVSVVAVHVPDLWQGPPAENARRSRNGGESGGNVILVVADGLRWQEIFRGADSLLLFGDPKALGDDPRSVRAKYWRADVTQRRKALMPFFWSTMVRGGAVFGNRDAGSTARVTNRMWFSYPGYNEMLVGFPDPRIDRNTYGPNPNVTVFEWLNRRDGFRGRVGVVGTWTAFHDIFNGRRSRLPIAAKENDASTHSAAMRYLREHQPRALFVGYGETDDWAHKNRYDRTLDAAHAIDAHLAEIWSAVQSLPTHSGRTTLVFVADHGRGRSPRDWTDHGKDVPGSDEMWIAVLGPTTTAAGERPGTHVTLAQTAATVAAAVGLDYDARGAAEAIPAVARRSRLAGVK